MVYWGSVRFFKHLIIAMLFLISLSIFVLLFCTVRPVSRLTGAPEQMLLSPLADDGGYAELHDYDNAETQQGLPDAAVFPEGDPGGAEAETGISDVSASPMSAADPAGPASPGDPGGAEAETGISDVSASPMGAADPAGPASPGDMEKPYQALYPDLYCDKPGGAIVRDKTVYLTFDDGPSSQTPKILKILMENNVKATFFAVGKADEASKEIMRQVVLEGHTLGVHSYTHNYRQIYDSVEAFLGDFYRMYSLIYEATGVRPDIFRFPGGSVNNYNKKIYKEIIGEMSRRGFTYYDWNVSALDAQAGTTKQAIIYNVMKASDFSTSIVLFHDSNGKSRTVEALDQIIKSLAEQGYSFDRLTNQIKPIIFKYK